MQFQRARIRGEDLAEFAEEGVEKSVKVLQEFREFAMKGNVVDMAVGIIIGGAFGTIAKSLVDDIIMPPVGLLLRGVDFKNWYWIIRDAPRVAGPRQIFLTSDEAKAAGAVIINFGSFVNNILVFLIVAFAVFLLVRSINRMRRREQAASTSPTDKPCAYCATTIPITAVRCPHCTSILDAAGLPPSALGGIVAGAATGGAGAP